MKPTQLSAGARARGREGARARGRAGARARGGAGARACWRAGVGGCACGRVGARGRARARAGARGGARAIVFSGRPAPTNSMFSQPRLCASWRQPSTPALAPAPAPAPRCQRAHIPQEASNHAFARRGHRVFWPTGARQFEVSPTTPLRVGVPNLELMAVPNLELMAVPNLSRTMFFSSLGGQQDHFGQNWEVVHSSFVAAIWIETCFAILLSPATISLPSAINMVFHSSSTDFSSWLSFGQGLFFASWVSLPPAQILVQCYLWPAFFAPLGLPAEFGFWYFSTTPLRVGATTDQTKDLVEGYLLARVFGPHGSPFRQHRF